MPATPLEIYLPCELLAIKVQVGPQENLSPLEGLFLEAVYERVNHFHELVDLFGIGHRPTLDLVFDLWRRGYLILDLAQGAVHLDSRVENLLAGDRLDELAGGESTDEVREVMQDRISGHVLSVSGRRKPPSSRKIAPAEHLDVEVQDITTADLLGALQRIVDDEEQQGRRKKVLSAHLSISQLDRSREQRWLSAHIECTLDEHTDRLAVRLLDGGSLPAAARTKVVERITQIVEDQPDSQFTKYLLENAATGIPSSPDVDDVLHELDEKTKDLAALDPSLHSQRQEQLDAVADELDEWLIERHDAEVATEIIFGHAEHSEIVADLVRSAARQILLVCPWLHYDAVSRLRGIVGEALDRGVQVFLLWGIRPDDEPDQNVRNILVDLRQRYPARFFVSQRSSRTHAKLVVQDDRRALVTSLNFLSPSGSGTTEAGVLVSARGPRVRCPPLEHFLHWARSAYPEFTPAQSLYLTREDFSRSGVLVPTSNPCPQRPVPPMIGRDSASTTGDLLTAALRLWQRSWDEYLSAAKALATPPTTAARVLIDGQHRDILWRALRTAERRLLIASDQLGPEVVDGTFLRMLEERLSSGVIVAIVYRRLSSHIDVGGADPMTRLADLRDRFSGRLRCVEAGNHTKVLSFDDIAVVSSFNFLSFDGYYEERRPAIRRKQRSEVGIMLSGRNTADLVFNAICGAFSDDLGEWISHPAMVEVAEAESSPSPSSLPRMEQEILDVLSRDEDEGLRADALKDALQGVDDPWRLLDRLFDARLPDCHLRMVAAVVLSSRWTEPQTESAVHWLHWLAQDAWRGKRFVEAAILCSACPDLHSPEVPGESVVMLAAAWATKTPESVLPAISDGQDLTEKEQLIVASVALADLMLRGSHEAGTALDNMGEQLPPAWKKCAQAAQSYWSTTFQALPVKSIRAEQNAAVQRGDMEARWSALEKRLGEGEEVNFKFAAGTKTREYLFHDDGPMGQLRSLAVARDAGGAAAWLAREGIDDLDAFLDSATLSATGRNDQYFKDGKRRSFKKMLDNIFDAARRVAESASPAATGEDSWRMDLARTVAKMLHQEWSNLETEAADSDLAGRAILEMLLDDIRFVADWGAV